MQKKIEIDHMIAAFSTAAGCEDTPTGASHIADFLSKFSLISSAAAAELSPLEQPSNPMNARNSDREADVLSAESIPTSIATHPKTNYAARVYDYLGALEKGASLIGVPVPEPLKNIRQLIGAFGRNIDNSQAVEQTAIHPEIPGRLANRLSIINNRVNLSDSRSLEQQVEDAIAQLVGGVTQVGIDILVARLFALLKLPVTGLSMYKAAAVQAAGGVAFGMTAQNFTTSIAKAGGDLMEEGCKAFFDAERARKNDTTGCSSMVPPDYAGFDAPYFPSLIPSTELMNIEEFVAKVVSSIKSRLKSMPNPDSDMTKVLRALDPSNPVDDPRFILKEEHEKAAVVSEKIETEVNPRISNLTELGRAMVPQQEVNTVKPPSFACTRDRLNHHFVIPDYVSKEMIEKQKGSVDYLYTMSEKGKLTIAKQTGLDAGEAVSHMDLARGQKVTGAGMMHVQDGKVVSIDNNAPDYEPDDTVKNSTEQAFLTNGFAEVKDKFIGTKGRRPATCSRDPEILRSAQAKCTEMDQTGSREQVAGRRDLNCQLLEQSTLSSYSLFRSSDRMNTPISASASAQSQLTPVDFAARRTNFSSIIAKGVQAPKPAASQTFFSAPFHSSGTAGSASSASTFRVSGDGLGGITNNVAEPKLNGKGPSIITITQAGSTLMPDGTLICHIVGAPVCDAKFLASQEERVNRLHPNARPSQTGGSKSRVA